MLSIEIKVNGMPVATFTAYNNGSGIDVADYPYRGFRFPVHRKDGAETFSGTVKAHSQHDGILDLSRRILECVVSGDG